MSYQTTVWIRTWLLILPDTVLVFTNYNLFKSVRFTNANFFLFLEKMVLNKYLTRTCVCVLEYDVVYELLDFDTVQLYMCMHCAITKIWFFLGSAQCKYIFIFQ